RALFAGLEKQSRLIEVAARRKAEGRRMVEALSEGGSGSRLKTAFVLAGGGSFGAVQVGMLHSLVAHGVTADMVVGSSVGAIRSGPAGEIAPRQAVLGRKRQVPCSSG